MLQPLAVVDLAQQQEAKYRHTEAEYMSSLKQTKVVSSIPGRTRFKLPPARRNYQEMERMVNGLLAHSEVHDVEFNVQTGSILVYYDPWQSNAEEISRFLHNLDVGFSDTSREQREKIRIRLGRR